MICDICFEDKNRLDMHHLECSHELCFNCFYQLRQNSCPFCRSTILLFTPDIDNNNENIFDDDFIVPVYFRFNRNEYRRRKKEKNRLKLENMLININDNIKHNNFLHIIPNSKKKMNKKLYILQKSN
jgi:hypothetical protein